MMSAKPNFFSDENGCTPATLLMHEEKHEPVFTQTEVRAMFIALSQKPGVSWQSLLKVAKEHDVVLDPA